MKLCKISDIPYENLWPKMHSIQMSVQHQHEMQQNFCICIRMRHTWFTNVTTKTVKQGGIFCKSRSKYPSYMKICLKRRKVRSFTISF
jgi:hypothetical protein